MIPNYLKFFVNDEAMFNVAGIDYFGKDTTSKLRFFYQHIIDHEKKISGDIFEFGVFRGTSLLATAILLKKIGSTKKIYGFDSFSGFPGYHENDSLDRFSDPRYFDQKFRDYQQRYCTVIDNNLLTVSSISSSKNFSNTSEETLLKKIKQLDLDNIELIVGDFKDTVPLFFKSKKEIFAANLDCDLYRGYSCVLENIWKYVSSNTFIHLDEYFSLKFPGARIAVDEFINKNNSATLTKINGREGEFPRYVLTKRENDG